MSATWRTGKLGDFIELKRGYDLAQAKRIPGPYPLVSSAGVSDCHSEPMAKGPGVVTGRYGTIGKVYFVEQDFWPLNTTLYVRDFKGNDPKFINYFLKTVDFLAYSDKAAVPGLNRNHLHEACSVIPDKATQLEIAAMLGALDDRITLLRETNATLEGIAQALFKSWFVDFDPVRANIARRSREGGNPDAKGGSEALDSRLRENDGPVLDEATARLFPDSFEESALGLVPRGWGTVPIYDIATFINGAAYKAFKPNADCRGRPIIKIAELKSGVTSQTAYSEVAMPEKYLIETGDILFSWSGNPDTSIDTFVWTFEPAWLNQHIFRVLPREHRERSFVLQILRHLKPVFTEMARNKQTTGLGHVTVADMKREHIAMPTVELLRYFDLSVGPIHTRISENQKQAQTLATLRDTLLPRLISGQLRLPAVQQQLADVTA
jgi:type I restriction enzyme S subunit